MSDDQQLPTLQRLGVDEPAVSSATEVATAWFDAFSAAVASSDINGILDIFLVDNFWKDVLALSWDFRTLEGRDAIMNLLDHRLAPTGLVNLRLSHEPFRAPELWKPFPDLVLLRLTFEFGTKVGQGTAVCYLAPSALGPTWQAYILYTCLHSLNDYPEQIGPHRPQVAEHGTWEDRRRREMDITDGDPTVLVVGAGFIGLGIAARLKNLGVSHLIWRDRYKVLCLHDPVWASHMPYLPLPTTWPVFSPAPKLADWLEGYVNYLELNIWTSSIITKMEWDGNLKTWMVEISRGGKETPVLRVKHVAFATGFVGHPKLPDISDKEKFKGEVLHSSEFVSASNYTGKKAIVVGACTSGHDIAQDFLNNGADVTIYQRSSTYIISTQGFVNFYAPFYNETLPTDLGDIYSGSLPLAVVNTNSVRLDAFQRQAHPSYRELLDGLAKVGFKTNLGIQQSGLRTLVFTRGGGYYIDTGTCNHIINGDIKLKSGSAIERFTEKGLRFEDGTELEADIVVFATGYGDSRDHMREVCSPQDADQVNELWGVTEEGELKSVWRDCGHDNLWFGIGNMALSRFHSRHLALQIKAMEAGILQRSEVKF